MTAGQSTGCGQTIAMVPTRLVSTHWPAVSKFTMLFTCLQSSCDPDRAYTDIPSLLSNQGASDTLDYMKKYWVDINGQDEQFWEHEWSKHGTCYSTLEPSCLPSSSKKGAEAVAFFETVVTLFKVGVLFWFPNSSNLPSSPRLSLHTNGLNKRASRPQTPSHMTLTMSSQL